MVKITIILKKIFFLEWLSQMEKRVIRTGGFSFSEDEKKALYKVIDSNRITEHNRTNEFEKNWAKTIGTRYSIAVNSGTSALISGLYALKYLNKEDKRKKVITTPLTFISTTNAIILSGLEPVYADVNPETFDINTKGIEKILKENNPKDFFAILPVHLMGYPCDMNEINRIAKENNLYVMEDAAEAHGTKYNGKNVGTFSDLSIYSFYVAHNVQGGELGAVNTNNREIRNLVRKIKAHGRACACDICGRMEGKCPNKSLYDEDMDPRFTFTEVGFNFKTNEFATAIANMRINQMEETNKKRQEIVQYLNEGLKDYSHILQLPKYSEDVSYLAYPIILKKEDIRSSITSKLQDRGIENRALFGCIPTQQPNMAAFKKQYEGKLPNAEYIGKNGFYIGAHQDMTKEDLDYIIHSFKEILK